MDLLVIVSNPAAGPILKPLAEACGRAGATWAVFFTDDGVKALGDETIVSALASTHASIACAESWDQHMDGSCPIERGSQTNNSALVGEAGRIVSL